MYNVVQTEICLVNINDEMIFDEAILIEGNGLCAIYMNDHFSFVCTTKQMLIQKLEMQGYLLRNPIEDRLCSECQSPMQEGFFFEGDGTQYCSKTCLTKVISWVEYLSIYNDGNGDAYWTTWET